MLVLIYKNNLDHLLIVIISCFQLQRYKLYSEMYSYPARIIL